MKTSFLKQGDRLLRFLVTLLPKKTWDLKSPPKRILVIKLSAIGDAVCLMPALRQLSWSWPDTKIDWLTTYRVHPDLFAAIPFIEQRIIMPVKPLPLAGFLLKRWRELRQYELILDFDQYYRISEILAAFGRNCAGFSTPLKGRTFPLAEVYDPARNEKMQFLALANRAAGVNRDRSLEYSPLLLELLEGYEPSVELEDSCASLKVAEKPVLVVYPGSSRTPNGLLRRWKLGNFIEVINRFSEETVLVVAGGPDEEEMRPELLRSASGYFDWINRWKLLEWVWIFKNSADLFFGTDAGLLHLADSQGLPVLGIYGPNLPQRWGSLQQHSGALEIILSCRPCTHTHLGLLPGTCERGDLACLNRITPAEAIDRIEKKLREQALH